MNEYSKPMFVPEIRTGQRNRYDNLSIILHWTTAMLVVAQFGLAELWDFFERPTHHAMVVTHMSLGIILTAVIAVRIAWRILPGHRVSNATRGWSNIASKTVHYLLYGLLASEVTLGFLLRWSENKALSFFGLPIPSPFSEFSKAVHEAIGNLHDWLAWTIIIFAVGHAFAAMFHQFILRDGLLRRMMPIF